MTQRPAVPPHLAQYAARDPEFGDVVLRAREEAFKPGALDVKTKFLIALALDISNNIPTGTANLALRCRAAGASDQELIEVVRVVYAVAGGQRIGTAALVFPEG